MINERKLKKYIDLKSKWNRNVSNKMFDTTL